MSSLQRHRGVIIILTSQFDRHVVVFIAKESHICQFTGATLRRAKTDSIDARVSCNYSGRKARHIQKMFFGTYFTMLRYMLNVFVSNGVTS